jgi:hypothetical protein
LGAFDEEQLGSTRGLLQDDRNGGLLATPRRYELRLIGSEMALDLLQGRHPATIADGTPR